MHTCPGSTHVLMENVLGRGGSERGREREGRREIGMCEGGREGVREIERSVGE